MNLRMTKIFVPAIFAISLSCFATDEGLLLSRETASGYVLPELQQSQTCKIFYDRVELEKTFNTAWVSETKTLDGIEGVFELARAANEGTLSRQTGPTDGPTATYKAYYQLTPNSTITKVLLKQSGDVNKNNSAPEATTLINLIDNLCD